MERLAPVDRPCLAECIDRIFSVPATHYHSPQRRILDGHRLHTLLEHLAEKSLGVETARRDRIRLQRVVLERAALLAKSASKLVVRCYSKSGSICLHPINRKITVERGT